MALVMVGLANSQPPGWPQGLSLSASHKSPFPLVLSLAPDGLWGQAQWQGSSCGVCGGVRRRKLWEQQRRGMSPSS